MSSSSQLKTATLVAAKLIVIGLALLVVWLVIPVSTLAQIVLTALVLLVWPAWVLIKYARRGGAAGGGQAGGAQSNGAGQKVQLPPVTGTYEALARGSEEIVQWLRGSKLGDARARDAAYALPWYVIAGPAGSGKTSLLLNSGLDFHVLPSQRAAEQRAVRPTQGCEWRVTDEAIWLDTSGRYQTEGPDRDEWAALIETLKRHRRARPLDGLVLAVNAAAVLRMSETEIEQQAKVLRARLDEALLRAGRRFPVYLVYTHMDEVDGFAEFFDSFTPEERAQVWGSTFPLAQSDGAQAQIDSEFDHLYARLLRRRVVQLGTAPAPGEQLRVFKFPGRFRRARGSLGRFATALFRPNPFSENPLLRGLYFTSGASVAPAGAGQTNGDFFARGLFRDVLLPDRNVVAAEQARRQNTHLLRDLLLGAAAAAALFLVVGMVVSYFNNKHLIATADAAGRRLTDIRKTTSKSRGSDSQVREELAAVEDVRGLLAALDEYEQKSPPPFMRFGLYAGGKLNSSDPANPSIIRHLYFEAVQDQFLKSTVARMEDDLRKFASGQTQPPAATPAASPPPPVATDEDYLGRHYDLLKAYLMLSKPDKVEPTFLAQTLRDYWERSAPAGDDEVALRQLDYFATQAGKEDAPHPEIDNALVAQAQDKLAAYPIVNRVYKRITSDINTVVKYPVKLSTIPNARDGNLLAGTYSVPGAFTVEGYREFANRMKSSVSDEFRKDDWVMRANVSAGENVDAKKDELANMYYRDYVAQWQRFLQEIKVRDYQSKEEAIRALRTLSGSTSPLDSVLREVARQVNPSAEGGFVGWVKSFFTSKTGVGGGGTQIEKEFRPLIQFVAGKDDASPTAEYRTQLKKVSDALVSNAKPIGEISKSLQAGNDAIGLSAARQAVADSLEAKGFNASPAADAAARLIQQPLDNLNTLLVGTDFQQLERAWQGLSAKSQGFEAGFPFTDGGPDISLAALSQYLNPQDGELTRFFNERLKPYFEDDWTVKKEAADKFSPAFVDYLGKAKRLRDALFPDGGRAPRAEYQLALAPAADGLVRVEIDGGAVSTPDKLTANLGWPGDKSGVRVTLTPTNGQDVTKAYAGEWGLLHMFRESGGGAGTTPPFALQPAAGVRLQLQPKSGNPFQRDLFAALKAPKTLRPEP
jgi:type VI secretion system protein ImpL